MSRFQIKIGSQARRKKKNFTYSNVNEEMGAATVDSLGNSKSEEGQGD